MRRPRPTDGPSMWTLAGECALDVNSPYAYALWGEYFSETSVVAVDESDRVVGFLTGFRVPASPETIFVWQVAVAADHRRKGLARRMLDEVVEQSGATCVEATVTPSNVASAHLFRSLGARHGSRAVETPLFTPDVLADGHEPEVRFRVPLGPPTSPDRRPTPDQRN